MELISTKEILKKLYDFNGLEENWNLFPNKKAPPKDPAPNSSRNNSAGNDPQASDPTQATPNVRPAGAGRDRNPESIHQWGGPMTRRALHAVYTLAFICLLRSDEVLKIRRQDLELVKEDDGTVYMVLTLPFRKTHQDGRM
jgi:hypothetical protein